jgi:urease accessory protein
VTDTDALLTALRLSDSMLPVGTYTASYGIEQYLNDGEIETADELGELVAGYLDGVIGPAELVALGAAHRSAAAGDLDGVVAADERLGAATLPAEFRDSATKAGTKLLELVIETDEDPIGGVDTSGIVGEFAAAVDDGWMDGHVPVVVGVVCQQAGIESREAAMVSAYASVAGRLGAA